MSQTELDARMKELWALLQASGPDSRAVREHCWRNAHCEQHRRSARMLLSIARRVQSPRPT